MRVEANLPGIFDFFYNKCIAGKCLTLKMKVKVREYTDRNGLIRWKISKSKKSYPGVFFASSHGLQENSHFKF